MLRVLSNILCDTDLDIDPKVNAKGKKAGIRDGVPSAVV